MLPLTEKTQSCHKKMALHTQGEKTNSRRLHISLILGQAKERQGYNKVFKPHARHGSSTDYSNQALLDFRDLTHSSKHTAATTNLGKPLV